jgi:hypothetical protein
MWVCWSGLVGFGCEDLFGGEFLPLVEEFLGAAVVVDGVAQEMDAVGGCGFPSRAR